MGHKKSKLILACNFIKNQLILMQFSLFDFKLNSTCDRMNFIHLTLLMSLHYLVKVETVKMHLNASSAFNVSTKQLLNASDHIDSFIKCSDESYRWEFISEHVFKVSAIRMHTWSRMVMPQDSRNIDNVRGQRQTECASSIFAGRRCRELLHTHIVA